MKVFKAGTRIKTKVGDIDGFVTGVLIRESSVEYNISHFVNGQHHQIWLFDYEIEINRPKTGPGFNRDRSNDDSIEDATELLIE